MNSVPFLFLFPLLLFGLESQKSLPGIKDQAGYFTPQVLDSANLRIQAIKEKYEIDIFIESYARVPYLKSLANPLDKHPKDSDDEHFFDKRIHDWFESKNSILPPNSIQILIVRNPGYIIVGVGRAMRYVGGFKQKDDNTLTKIMQSHFQLAKYDEAIFKGLDYIENVLAENLSGIKIMQQARKTSEGTSKSLSFKILDFLKHWGLILTSALLLIWVLFTSFKIVRDAPAET